MIGLILLSSCNSPKKILKIAATLSPHSKILEYVRPELRKFDIDLEIVIVNCAPEGNFLLQEALVDANFCQHGPFLEEAIGKYEYDFTSLVETHIEPLGLYSLKYHLILMYWFEPQVRYPHSQRNLQEFSPG